MINLSSIKNQPFLRQALKISVQQELSALGTDNGYASSRLSEKCYQLGISSERNLTKQDLKELAKVL